VFWWILSGARLGWLFAGVLVEVLWLAVYDTGVFIKMHANRSIGTVHFDDLTTTSFVDGFAGVVHPSLFVRYYISVQKGFFRLHTL
jgi:hypothetical protein